VREISWAEMLRRAGALAATLRRVGRRPPATVSSAIYPTFPRRVIGFPGRGQHRGDLERLRPGVHGFKRPSTGLANSIPPRSSSPTAYRFGGKVFDRRTEVAALRRRTAGPEKTAICVPRIFWGCRRG